MRVEHRTTQLPLVLYGNITSEDNKVTHDSKQLAVNICAVVDYEDGVYYLNHQMDYISARKPKYISAGPLTKSIGTPTIIPPQKQAINDFYSVVT